MGGIPAHPLHASQCWTSHSCARIPCLNTEISSWTTPAACVDELRLWTAFVAAIWTTSARHPPTWGADTQCSSVLLMVCSLQRRAGNRYFGSNPEVHGHRQLSEDYLFSADARILPKRSTRPRAPFGASSSYCLLAVFRFSTISKVFDFVPVFALSP